MRCDAFCGHFTAAVTGHAYGTLHPACLPAVSDACLPAPTCARSLASRGSTYSGYIHRLRLSMASPSSSLVGSGDSRDRDASYYYCTHGAGSGADTVRVGTAANLHHSANCSGKLRMHFSRSSRSDSDRQQWRQRAIEHPQASDRARPGGVHLKAAVAEASTVDATVVPPWAGAAVADIVWAREWPQ
jgi:hypothetical protein